MYFVTSLHRGVTCFSFPQVHKKNREGYLFGEFFSVCFFYFWFPAFCFSAFPCFFASPHFPAGLLLCFSAFSCFSASWLLCFFGFLLFCCFISLPLCLSAPNLSALCLRVYIKEVCTHISENEKITSLPCTCACVLVYV